MREGLREKIIEAFNKAAESKSSDMEPPDYLMDSAKETVDLYWSEMDDGQKFERPHLVRPRDLHPAQLVIVPLDFVAIGWGQTCARKVQCAVHFVLVPHQRIVADNLLRFKVASAVEAVCIVDVATSIVDGGLRVRAERAAAASRRCGRAAAGKQGLRRNAILDPVHQRAKGIYRARTRATGPPRMR
jgi:hypothetical protein